MEGPTFLTFVEHAALANYELLMIPYFDGILWGL